MKSFKKQSAILFFTIVTTPLLFSQTLKQAIKLTENEQFENAAKVYQNLIQADPSNGNNYFYFGENYFQSDDLESARKMYQKGADVNATNAINYVGLGKVQWYQKNFTDAKANFFKATTLSKSKDAVVLMKIAEVYTKADDKNLEEALKLLEQAKSLAPKNPDVYILMGDAQLEKDPGNGTLPIASYEKAAELDKSSVKAILRIGKLFSRSKNYQLALDKYKEAEKIDTTFAPAYREKAELYYKFNQYEKAIAQYKKYLALNDNLSARIRYASFLFLSKQYPSSVAEIKEIQKKDSSNVILHRLIAYGYYETGDYVNGNISINKFFTKATPSGTKLLPSDYEYQGKLMMKTGQDSLGALTLLKAIAMDSTKTDLYTEIGTNYFKAKKYADAIYYFDKKIAALGKSATATDYNSLGRAYFFNKEFVKADSSFSVITRIMPDLPLGYAWRAKSNSQLDPKNDKWLAKPYYELFIQKVKPEETEKSKKDLVEANSYLGYYYFVKKDYAQSKLFWTKVKELDPTNDKAKKALDDANLK